MTPSYVWDPGLIALIISIAFLGGWFVHDFEVRRRSRRTRGEQQLVQEVLANLHTLIDNVSADMGQHSDCLAEISENLTVSPAGDTKLVATGVNELLAANHKIRQRLDQAEIRLKEQSRTIKSQAAEARTDSLTRLVNRRAFDDEMNRCYAAFKRQGRGFSIVLLDIDHFKGWNDTFGHPAGDHVLMRVAEIMKRHAREMDLVARYGGEEFAIILPGATLAAATAAAERVRGAIEETDFTFEGEPHTITISGGAAEVRSEDTVTTLIGRADAALYESKAAGRNCVHGDDGNDIVSAKEITQCLPIPLVEDSRDDDLQEILFDIEVAVASE
jgi:diguanylate cyclase (GGDEF)-like protein